MDIISPATGNTVEPLYKPKESHSLPVGTFTVINPPIKSAKKSPPRQSVLRDDGPAEMASASLMNPQDEQRNDIHRLFTMLDDLQDEMSSIKKVVDGMAIKTGSLGGHTEQNPRAAAGFEAELDLLADTVSQINERVNEVPALRLEVKILKRRIQRLEDSGILTQSSHTVTGLTQDPVQNRRPSEMDASVSSRPHPVAQRPFVPETLQAPPQSKRDEISESPVKVSVLHDEPVGSNDSEMITKSMGIEKVDAGQKGIPLKIQLAERSTSPNSLMDKASEMQQGSSSNQTHSDTTMSMDFVPTQRLSFLSDSSSSSRMSSLPTDSPPRPRTPPATRLKRQQAPSGISLNNHEIIPGSDPEDEDYEPNSVPSPKTPPSRGIVRTRGPGRGRRSAQGIALPPPEWEQPGWIDPNTLRQPPSPAASTRGKGVTRRSIGGKPKGPATEQRPRRSLAHIEPAASEGESRSAGRSSRHRTYDDYGNRLRANGEPDRRFMKRHRDEEGNLLTSRGTPDGRSIKRPRDENGFLLRANGQLDGRSLVRGKKTGK
ncbi:hypothetical protein MMC07_007902 [Pseudocyphellaria aurata]|nr:hypothetical protein [Pseudocyphellaria aurata]